MASASSRPVRDFSAADGFAVRLRSAPFSVNKIIDNLSAPNMRQPQQMRHTANARRARALAYAGDPPVQDLVHELEFDILFGNLKPRERLVEDALMQRFSAKRHAVRQALGELERMGVVTRAPNRGAAVRDFSAEEVEEIAELRETLQRRAAQRMKLPADALLIDKLVALQRRHDKAVAARDPRAIDNANEAFHSTLFGACGNRHLAQAISHYAYLSRAMRLYPLVDRTLLERLRSEHWAMIEALKVGDRKLLMRLVVDHIQHSKRIYLEVRGSLADASR
jgi:DNA-binding GntR family transcriptional regulator